MCASIKSTTACIDTVIKEFDHDILEKKKDLEARQTATTAKRKLFAQETGMAGVLFKFALIIHVSAL